MFPAYIFVTVGFFAFVFCTLLPFNVYITSNKNNNNNQRKKSASNVVKGNELHKKALTELQQSKKEEAIENIIHRHINITIQKICPVE